ncbi:hypothetical protein HPB47_017146 [Ixodes persulcatus]|uniref:Uncharacterized protein n=1 Tax=Ixodes persulcatus TaxID=34615 RepID=A0AC60QPB0_IXOPE|nr:hypothetical protein HPB47_017146 [Ixodes persulcatus]
MTLTYFVVELNKLAATCEFGAFLEEALRERRIAGLQAGTIRCRLLAMPDTEVTWDHACSIATATEAAAQDKKNMLTSSNAGTTSERQGRQLATSTSTAASDSDDERADQVKGACTESDESCGSKD